MKQLLIAITICIFCVPLMAAELPELKKCNIHKVQKPIQTSTGSVFVLRDGKWQLAKK